MKINSILDYIGENNSIYRDYKGVGEIDDNNLRQGVWEEYWVGGELFSKGTYVNGEKDGYWEEYWKNGNLSSKGNFVNSIRH